jgi:hypothetical protein
MRNMMIDIYVNEATGKKIKVYKQTMVHVYDHEDPSDILDFRDTAKGVAEWCMENLMTGDEYYDEMEEAYADENWEQVIEYANCRNCEYEYDEEWVVEEVA